MSLSDLRWILVAVLVAPLVGGLVSGIDRCLSARLQSRMGPPVLQPFYDAIKLFSKRGSSSSKLQTMLVWMFLVCNVLALVLLALQNDMIVFLYLLGLGSVSFILASYSVRSPYALLGAQRETLQLLIYEPLLIFMVIGMYLHTKTFLVAGVFTQTKPLLYTMPVYFFTMVIVLLIKLRKSPFDIAASAHHAHQEVVQGPLTEMSGPTLGLVEVAHWYETVLLLALVSLLWATNPIGAILLAIAALVCATMIENLTARLTWGWMLRFGWTVGIAAAILNLAFLYWIHWK